MSAPEATIFRVLQRKAASCCHLDRRLTTQTSAYLTTRRFWFVCHAGDEGKGRFRHRVRGATSFGTRQLLSPTDASTFRRDGFEPISLFVHDTRGGRVGCSRRSAAAPSAFGLRFGGTGAGTARLVKGRPPRRTRTFDDCPRDRRCWAAGWTNSADFNRFLRSAPGRSEEADDFVPASGADPGHDAPSSDPPQPRPQARVQRLLEPGAMTVGTPGTALDVKVWVHPGGKSSRVGNNVFIHSTGSGGGR